MRLKSTFSAPILALVVIFMLAASRFIDLAALSLDENICLAVIVLELSILALPSAFYTKMRGAGFGKKLRISFCSMEKVLIALLAAVVLFFGNLLIKLAGVSIGLIDSEYSVWRSYLNGTNPGFLYEMITFCLLPSILEELLFRGLFCAEYESGGAVTAAVASSLLYAMFGLSFRYFAVYLFTGLMMALLLYMTKSVIACMICRFSVCLTELALGETIWTLITKPQSTVFLIFALTALFLASLAALLGECERICENQAAAGQSIEYAPVSKGKSFAEALLSPPFLICFFVYLASAIEFL